MSGSEGPKPVRNSPTIESSMFCSDCGSRLDCSSAATCPLCGSRSVSAMACPRGVQGNAGCGPVGVVTAGADSDGTGARIQVRWPSGSSSEAVIHQEEDRGHLTVRPPVDAGRRGEPRALETIMAWFQSQGIPADVRPGQDSRGEDGVLVVAKKRYVLQLVSVPHDPIFWRRVDSGSATESLSPAEAVELLHRAVDAKSASMPRSLIATTVLGIDALHVGVLSGPAVTGAYLVRYGAPSAEFGSGASSSLALQSPQRPHWSPGDDRPRDDAGPVCIPGDAVSREMMGARKQRSMPKVSGGSAESTDVVMPSDWWLPGARAVARVFLPGLSIGLLAFDLWLPEPLTSHSLAR